MFRLIFNFPHPILTASTIDNQIHFPLKNCTHLNSNIDCRKLQLKFFSALVFKFNVKYLVQHRATLSKHKTVFFLSILEL